MGLINRINTTVETSVLIIDKKDFRCAFLYIKIKLKVISVIQVFSKEETDNEVLVQEFQYWASLVPVPCGHTTAHFIRIYVRIHSMKLLASLGGE